ncbi:MAG: hypothetical protein KQ78_01702 [Candidatus Izimaplasma bacterium HR2]|nr:MAG: hypothetical protein KQ78_01702 [Candidatus Izimaplasma bacterium HR2]
MKNVLESKNLYKIHINNDVEFHTLRNIDLGINQSEFVTTILFNRMRIMEQEDILCSNNNI